MNDVSADEKVSLAKDERQGSAPCSDYINNTSMSASGESHANFEEQSLGKKGVETWLHNDVHDTEQIATGKEEPQSDTTDTPKRPEMADTAFVFVNSGEDEERPVRRSDCKDKGDVWM